jgi:ABC-type lipoprotein export system ATPase subunit
MDFLARVGVADLASRFPAQLSGGQQQRVAVARVLAREPKLLLADEPTGNLDEESGERIFECIRSLQRQSGITCIMVTHDADLAARVDGVVRLRDGRVVVSGRSPTRSGVLPTLGKQSQAGRATLSLVSGTRR